MPRSRLLLVNLEQKGKIATVTGRSDVLPRLQWQGPRSVEGLRPERGTVLVGTGVVTILHYIRQARKLVHLIGRLDA
jgi:hypothetical protein